LKRHCLRKSELVKLPERLKLLAPGTESTLLAVDAVHNSGLHGPELVAVTNAVDTRKSQFASGRAAVRSCSTRLGFTNLTVPVGRNREPIWPAGMAGSISHTSQWAVAWVADQYRYEGLGVDLEDAAKLPENAWALILSDEESSLVDASADTQLAATVLFSTKESIYKAIYPTVQRFVDFREVSLVFEEESGRLSPQLLGKLSDELAGCGLEIGFRLYGRLVASWAVLRKQDSQRFR
jgi:4'-phosphopantetheinyl transferase EntD